MLKNYFKIAFRTLLKNKLFSSITILGMAISLASCFLIALFVWDELQFDRHHPDGDRTFRVYIVRNGDDGVTNHLPIVPLPFASYMQKDFPEIESTMRLMNTYGEKLFEIHDKKILESNGIWAEPTAFDFLSLKVIEGSPGKALEKPNTIALSQSLARKHFPNGKAMDETIKIDNELYQVTAIFEDAPEQFHLKVNFLLSLATVYKNFTPQRFENWQNQAFYTYLKLKPGTDAKALEAKFLPFVEKYAYPKIKAAGFTYVPYLQNIKDIHLYSSRFEWEIAQRGNAQMVYILSFTGILLLVIACLNFINLSTARSVRRMKEVGIRKVVGALRKQLVMQFMCESVVVTLIGLAIAVGISELAIPYLNAFAEKNLFLPTSLSIVSSVVGFCILIGILAGSYPAFQLSYFKPAAVLTSKLKGSGGSGLFRQGLVVLQFMFSFFLIAGSLVVVSQNDLLRNKDHGFSKDHLVMIPLRSAQLKQQESTKREFSNHPNILSSTLCFGIPGDVIAGDGVTDPITNKSMPANLFCVDHDYIQTMQMHIVAGRDFSRDFTTDATQAFIINETAVKTFGYGTPENAIGKPLHWEIWGTDSLKKGTVIGVVKDFHFKSLREQLSPMVMHIAPDYVWKITLRIKPENIQATMAHLKSTYERLDPEWPFTYKFVDENFDDMYKSEEKLSSLFSIFTGLTIAVACFGLFGLVEYSVNQRSKEISIRKVFGASVHSLLLLLTRKYFVLIAIAFFLIIPLSYYAADEWLNNFAYHITISPWLYVKACGLILMITIFTVSFQSLKAAWNNPIDALRNE